MSLLFHSSLGYLKSMRFNTVPPTWGTTLSEKFQVVQEGLQRQHQGQTLVSKHLATT